MHVILGDKFLGVLSIGECLLTVCELADIFVTKSQLKTIHLLLLIRVRLGRTFLIYFIYFIF